jgi:hypothetical protein
MRQQVAVDPDQVASLVKPLPATAQQRLCLAVELEHAGEDLASCDLGVPVGERDGRLLDVLNRLVAGVGRGDPGRQAFNVVRYSDPCAGRGRRLAVFTFGEQQPELRAGLRGCLRERDIKDLLHHCPRDSIGPRSPVGDSADANAQALGEGLVGHAQRLAQDVSATARPRGHYVHASCPYRFGANLHRSCTVFASWWHGREACADPA